MSILTMTGAGSHARRHAARGDPPARRTAVVGATPAAPKRSAPVRTATRARRRTAVEIGGITLLVLALHTALVMLSRTGPRSPAEPLVPPRPLPMTVELTRPPVPLPQAKQAPPPPMIPPQPVRQTLPPKPVARAPAAKPAPSVVPTPAAPQAAPSANTVAVPAAAPVAPPQPAPVVESAPIGNAAYLHNPAPDYPSFAQDQGWEGHVLLRVHVLANGKPDSVEIRTGSGRKMLDDAAIAAVRKWSFVPAKRGGEAVDGWVNVPIDFRLGG